MQATQRRRDTGLIRELRSDPYRFAFFQAVRILERWLQRDGDTASGRVLVERFRFLNSSSLAFPPSEIGSIAFPVEDEGAQDRSTDLKKPTDAGPITLTPAFFTLLGAQGALPHYFTETLADHESSTRDPGVRAFLDIFCTRITALFYGAWKKHRLPLLEELDGERPYLSLLLALGGIGHSSLRNRLRAGEVGVFDESLANYAATLQHRPVSSAHLRSVLSDYFQLPMRIEPFVGKWYTLPRARGTRLGCDGALLGNGARMGERVWQRNISLRVWIGPLDHRGFCNFLPGGSRAAALGQLLVLLMGPGYEYEVCIILRKADVSGCVLDERAGVRLGHDSFLCTQAATQDRDDMVYVLDTSRSL